MGQGNEIIVRVNSLAKVSSVIGVIDRLESLMLVGSTCGSTGVTV